MKRAVQIISLLALLTVMAAIVSQALTVTQGIYYDPNGQPVNPSTMTQVVTILGIAGLLALPLVAGAFILGLIATVLDRRYGWLVAVLIAGAVALVGLFAMAWVLLSERSLLAFQTPLAVVPLVTLAYTLAPARGRATAAGAF